MRSFFTLLLLLIVSSLIAQQQFDWLYTIHNGSDKSISSLAFDNEGNLISTGFFKGTLDFDPGPDTLELIANGTTSSYILKTNSSGKPLWVKQINFSINSSLIDSLGNMFILGVFKDTADFDLSDSTQNIVSTSIYGSAFIAAYDKNLNVKWVKLYPDLNTLPNGNIKMNSKGDIYWAGVFRDTVDFDLDTGVFKLFTSNNLPYSFITKIDSLGNFIWAKKIEEKSFFDNTQLTAFEIDKNDNLIIAGTFQGDIDFDLDSTVFQLKSAMANGNPFVAKYDQAGQLLWAKSMGVSFIEDENFIRSMSLDDSSNVYLSGGYPDSIAFPVDSNSWISLKSHIRHGSRGESKNGFIAKFDANGKAKWAKSLTDLSGNFILNYHFVESIKVDKFFQVHTLGFYGRDTLVFRNYNAAGKLVSTDSINGNGVYIESHMVLDKHSSTYVVGRYLFGKIDFDPDSTSYYDSTFNWKGFIAKYNYKPLAVGVRKDIELNQNLSIFPNPSKEGFLIKGATDELLDIDIYNIKGQMITQLRNHEGIIDENLQKGLYLIIVSQKNGKTTNFKLVVE